MEISPDEIADILEAINKLDCTSVEVTVGDVSIAVRRGSVADVPTPSLNLVKAHDTPSAKVTPSISIPLAATPASPHSDATAWVEQETQGKVHIVRAPIIGTFYSAKSPGEPPFVEVGSSVQQGDTLGLMEVMKLFNSLIAEAAGTVEAILAQNGEMVEYDQPVFVIRLA